MTIHSLPTLMAQWNWWFWLGYLSNVSSRGNVLILCYGHFLRVAAHSHERHAQKLRAALTPTRSASDGMQVPGPHPSLALRVGVDRRRRLVPDRELDFPTDDGPTFGGDVRRCNRSRTTSTGTAAAPEAPSAPENLQQTGLTTGFLNDMILRTLYTRGGLLGLDLARLLCLPFKVIEESLGFLKNEKASRCWAAT